VADYTYFKNLTPRTTKGDLDKSAYHKTQEEAKKIKSAFILPLTNTAEKEKTNIENAKIAKEVNKYNLKQFLAKTKQGGTL
jgi:hypothetical protein